MLRGLGKGWGFNSTDSKGLYQAIKYIQSKTEIGVTLSVVKRLHCMRFLISLGETSLFFSVSTKGLTSSASLDLIQMRGPCHNPTRKNSIELAPEILQSKLL